MNKILLTLITIITVINFQSCSLSEGPRKVFSRPSGRISLDTDNKSTLLPIFSNHGLRKGLYPKKELAPQNSPKGFPQTLNVGGAEVLSHYLRLIKRKFNDNALILDAGDTSHANDDIKKLAMRLKVMEKLPFDSVLFSGEDYLSQDLFNNWSDYQIPFLNSNILDLRTQKPIKLTNLFSSQIIEKSGLKIGLIGLIDIQSLSVEKQKKLNGVYFQDLVAAFLKFKNRLRAKGAQILILLSHIPTQCQSKPIYEAKKGKNIPKLRCASKDPLKQFIERLPQNSLDLIVLSGRSHGSGRIGKFLVLNEPVNGHYLGQVSLFFDHEKKRVLFEKNKLHPRIKTCHKFFASTLDCHVHEVDWRWRKNRHKIMEHSAYALIPAKFLGFEVQADAIISAILNDR